MTLMDRIARQATDLTVTGELVMERGSWLVRIREGDTLHRARDLYPGYAVLWELPEQPRWGDAVTIELYRRDGLAEVGAA